MPESTTLPAERLAGRPTPGRPRLAIDPAIRDAFGTAPDQDIADRFGRSLKWVRKHRQRLKIACYSGNKITPKLAQNDEVMALLGKVSDRSLAGRFGGSHHVYRTLRDERGIPPWNHEHAEAEAELWESNRPEAVSLLGKLPDIELARRYGGYQSRYSYLRKKAGIAPYSKQITTGEDV